MTEQAIRLPDIPAGGLPTGLDDMGICYWKGDGAWWIYLPRAGVGCLSAHQVEEHKDGTITVSPSIGLRNKPGHALARHGYLVRGQWQEA